MRSCTELNARVAMALNPFEWRIHVFGAQMQKLVTHLRRRLDSIGPTLAWEKMSDRHVKFCS